MLKTKLSINWGLIKTKFFDWHLNYASIFLIMLGYYGWLQRVPYIGDPDGFYHAKMALFLRQGIILKALPWMQFSTLRDHFTDHHLLYHALLVPFTFIQNNPLIGVKVAAVVFAALMVTAFYWLLKKFDIAWPAWLTLLFITLSGLNFRLSLIKVSALSILVIWLMIYALYKEKIWLTFILGFIFVWLYGGWPIALLVLAAYLIADKIYYFIHQKKIKLFHKKIIIALPFAHKAKKYWQQSLALIAGLGAGLVINPYFPNNIYFYYQQFVQIGVINMGNKFSVGEEWYGANLGQVVSVAPHIFALACVLFVVLFYNHRRISRWTIFSFGLTFIFLFLTMKSRRYLEYYSPFLLLYVACALNDVKNAISWKKIGDFWNSFSWFVKSYLAVTIMVFFILAMPKIYEQTLNTAINKRLPFNQFSGAALWLKNNTPAHSLVFHTDWDEWPMLFYFNDQNYYMVGLDFTFMYNYDPALQKEYIDITTNQAPGPLAKKIKQDFGANYIFVEKASRDGLLKKLDTDPDMSLVYQDEKTAIYKINL